ncbi:response regulator [Phenylobacterium sp. LjRoot225]|uniref:response regulator n=1 Tax=Phenylobacterium sp. LjRoot225 TaxID=3342285 RepID=UPI003ECF059F
MAGGDLAQLTAAAALDASELRRSRPKRPLAGARILVADDVAVNRELTLLFLQMLGCSVTLAEDGAAAIERWEHEPFDLVLMDLLMPVMDGWSAAREIRRRDGQVPIFAITASDADQAAGLAEAGFDGRVEKPFRLDQLADALADWFEG